MFIGKKQKSYLRGTPKPKTGLTFSVLHKVIPLTELILTMQVATQNVQENYFIIHPSSVNLYLFFVTNLFMDSGV